MKKASREDESWVAGMDLGDRSSEVCVVGSTSSEVLTRQRVPTTREAMTRWFGSQPPMRVVIEVGAHSPWVSRLLADLDHEVIVANTRKLSLITRNRSKDDSTDAELLARLGRSDLGLLSEVKHRSEDRQVALAMVRSRAQLVAVRTSLVAHCRGVVKALGYRLPACSVRCFPERAAAALPTALDPALSPLLEQITAMNRTIGRYDRQLEKMADERFPETQLLTAIRGVGPLTAMAFVLTIEDPRRFQRSREVGAFLGLVPARAQSGDRNPQLRITKQGDRMLRALLVQCAHYVLGPFGHDCDLRRFGERVLARGGKHSRKVAVVAVARKLAVLMLALWRRGEAYDPLFLQSQAA